MLLFIVLYTHGSGRCPHSFVRKALMLMVGCFDSMYQIRWRSWGGLSDLCRLVHKEKIKKVIFTRLFVP